MPPLQILHPPLYKRPLKTHRFLPIHSWEINLNHLLRILSVLLCKPNPIPSWKVTKHSLLGVLKQTLTRLPTLGAQLNGRPRLIQASGVSGEQRKLKKKRRRRMEKMMMKRTPSFHLKRRSKLTQILILARRCSAWPCSSLLFKESAVGVLSASTAHTSA